ncbi:hypothetical protein CRG98_033386 [Punica granatum]|uniref:Uncharacterized protein n=1 Tax=Punica granatum TaxID=22663 RepID=A0A2I0IQB6_PUNGR|nr:hypothetical protein CRG98_033386 [Punica granatum]
MADGGAPTGESCLWGIPHRPALPSARMPRFGHLRGGIKRGGGEPQQWGAPCWLIPPLSRSPEASDPSTDRKLNRELSSIQIMHIVQAATF